MEEELQTRYRVVHDVDYVDSEVCFSTLGTQIPTRDTTGASNQARNRNQHH